VQNHFPNQSNLRRLSWHALQLMGGKRYFFHTMLRWASELNCWKVAAAVGLALALTRAAADPLPDRSSRSITGMACSLGPGPPVKLRFRPMV
jgi:hypothetical protein